MWCYYFTFYSALIFDLKGVISPVIKLEKKKKTVLVAFTNLKKKKIVIVI